MPGYLAMQAEQTQSVSDFSLTNTQQQRTTTIAIPPMTDDDILS